MTLPAATAVVPPLALAVPPAARPWPASRFVLVLGLALTALVALALVGLGWLDCRAAIEDGRQNQNLMARVLEDHATRTVESAALAINSLADRIEERPGRPAAEVGAMLRDVLSALPFMRSLALVDGQGMVLAATSVADAPGRVIDLKRLGPLPVQHNHDWLGPLVAGRGLGELATGAPSHAPQGLSFIPLMRLVHLGADTGTRLVGILNPDILANSQALMLADAGATAVLANYRGDLLATTASAGVTSGQRIGAHPLFSEQMLAREHGSYVGAGLLAPADGGPQIVSFRASRTRPLVVIVERSAAAVRAAWRRDVLDVAAVCAAAIALLGGMTVVAWRGMRARERTRGQLDLAQHEVARRERELSITVTSVQELIFRTDRQGAVTFVNARWEAFSGAPPEGAVGVRLAELAVPEQRARAEVLFDPQAGPGVRAAQVAIRRLDRAAPRLFEFSVVPLVETDGSIVGYAGSAVDVTDRVTAQQRLQTQLAVTELILENSPLPLSLRDVDGRYRSVNQAWEEFTGVARDQVLGRAVASQLTSEEHEFHAARDRELLERGAPLRYEANVMHRDGSRRDVVLVKVLLPGDSGASAGILTVLMDVSEFRSAERATREARDAAEEASRAKSEFVANISHELRTPLQSILGFSELGVARGQAQPRLAAMFQDIHASGQRMLALVNDLLDVAKIESSVGTFHLERTDLRPLITAVVHELSPQTAARNLHLDVQLAPQPLIAKVDPLRFQQVVRNVLANAIRFTPPRSRIELHADTTADAWIHLRVKDQGPGIPPSELERIFDAFAQSSTTKDGSGGTGLGLTICRKIVEIQDGRIDAENCAGGGAAFNIYIPLKASQESAPMPL